MATEKGVKVASAVVAVIPSFEGARKSIGEQLTPVITGASDDAGKKAGKNIGGKLSEGLSTAKIAIGNAVGNLMTSAVSKTASVIKNTFQQAFEGFGEYEQLVGGAQKIFDQMDYAKIAKDASNAYKELNMSASEYLESINLAGATFAQTMGDEKGYDIARRGMMAISDYASGTGKNIEELNQKYQLITRAASSYQSIADQFSGILPATSADFLAQAKAAGFLKDEYTKLTEVPVAEYQEAVTKMLEKGVADLGLAQNTMKESTNTLTGSLAMTKAAWSNFLVGLADPNADLKLLATNLVDSIKTAFTNAIPAIDQIIQGVIWSIGQMFEEAGWVEASEMLLNAYGNIQEGFAEFIEYAKTNIMPVAKDIFNALGDVFYNVGGIIINYIIPAVAGFFNWLGRVGEAAQNLWSKVSESLMAKIEGHGGKLAELFQGSLNGAPDLLTAIGDGIVNGIGWLAEHGDEIADAIIVIIDGLDALAKVIEAISIIAQTVSQFVLNTIMEIANWIQNDPVGQAVGRILNGLVGMVTTAFNLIKGSTEVIFGAIVGIATGDWSMLTQGIQDQTSGMKSFVTNLWEMLAGTIEAIVRNVFRVVTNIFDSIASNVAHAPENIANTFRSLPDKIWGFISGIPGMFSRMFSQIHIPQLHVVGDFDLNPAHFKLPSIQFYAEGGWVGRPTAIAGEAGNEVVLSERGRFTNRFADAIAAHLNDRGGRGGDTYFVIDGAIVNSDEAMERNFYNNMIEITRKAGMYV